MRDLVIYNYVSDLEVIEKSDLRHLECTQKAINDLKDLALVTDGQSEEMKLSQRVDDIMESYTNQAAFYANTIISAYNRIVRKVNFQEFPQSEPMTELNGIKLNMNDEYLCVVTPRLPSRNRMYNDRSYGETVWRLLASNRNRLPAIKDKVILIYMVYDTGYSEAYKIDPDNVDAKHIVDQVADFYAGDGGNNTIYISAQCTTDEIGTGTYIMCLPITRMTLDRRELLNLIKDIM